MADSKNFIYEAEKLSAVALANIEQSVVLAGTVQKHPAAEFDGAKGHVVNVRRPAMLNGFDEDIDAGKGSISADDSYTARAIKSEALNETVIGVKLDRHVYSAVDLSDAEMSLSVSNFATQVAMPQTEAIVNKLEFMIANLLSTGKNDSAGTSLWTSENSSNVEIDLADHEKAGKAVRFAIAQLATQLTQRNIPTSGRFLVMGAQAAGLLLADPNLSQVQAAGEASALRDATITRLHGFTIVQDNRIGEYEIYAYHPTAIQLVTRAPAVPAGGVAAGSSAADGGYAIRWIRDYNSMTASERSFLSSYAGVTFVTDRTRDKQGKVVETPKLIRAQKVTFKPKGAQGGAPTK
ncbi:P22 phage major capsid protein family protein [Streptomyces yunnanensis]|uniref:P22 coat protein-gene protein 5 n=1 Tax=Streptomyces yunnanensis TaxID=156453 RepID=A0A9X8N7Y9_9ACTN|nr:P22 phage major capsid protein family protein [Streptomyces yunnanensis]SHN24713.1 P22 coat protein-gene protein 5 [Streptomyces yunnanensis]